MVWPEGSTCGDASFIILLGGAATWPFAARAQQRAMPVIGYLGSSSLAASDNQLAGFRQGLKDASFAEGRNLAIEYRWSDGLYSRLPAVAAELAGRQVAVILASGLPAALAAKATVSTIPIVFVMGADPVTSGLVPNFNRPGGNVTGISQFYGALGGKRLELLREIVPAAAKVAVLTNPDMGPRQGWRFAPPRYARLRPELGALETQCGYRAVATVCRPPRRSAQTTSSRTIALSIVIILRITATITTFGTLPAAFRRLWKVLSREFQ